MLHCKWGRAVFAEDLAPDVKKFRTLSGAVIAVRPVCAVDVALLEKIRR